MDHAREVFQPLQADDPVTVAGYRIAARLGAGGMGRVYLSHTQGGRPVAIKVVRPELADDPEFRRRFSREIRAARRVRGAYTAELIDADGDGVPPWLATLYVPGPSLTEAVARRGPLPVPAVLWLMAGVAEALQAIHAEGIVHRDLKPSNVLLAADGPRVIDFGIALAADVTSHTATGAAIGTPAYMAPEQASAGDITPATDVFALGQTAAFAALGRPLYGDGPAVNVLYRIVHDEPDLSLLPEPLRPLLARCLAADPAERATPAEIVEWCRKRLGADAEGGGGPAVWREVTGPEVMVPAPVPEPTQVHTMPFATMPQQPVPWAPPMTPTMPMTPEERKARRRRTALITTAALAAGGLVLSGTAWLLNETVDRLDQRSQRSQQSQQSQQGQRDTAPSPSTGPTESAGSSESSAGSGSGSDGGPGDTEASEAADRDTGAPVAHPYPGVTLDGDNSMSFAEPVQREDRKGDVRFVCGETGCALESDTSVMMPMLGQQGTTAEMCRLFLDDATTDRVELAIAATGTEICMKHESGAVALYVIQVKSTALPELGFLLGDLTVWREA